MPTFSIAQFNYYITVPSTTQSARVQDLLKKNGQSYLVEGGRIYTEQSPSIPSDILKTMGAKAHSVGRQKKDKTDPPPVKCSYGSGCTFQSADMDELADHLRGHYPTVTVSENQPKDQILEEEMVQTDQDQKTVKGITVKGRRIGKFTQTELVELRKLLEEGVPEVEISRKLGRRVSAVRKWIEKLRSNGQSPGDPTSQSSSGGTSKRTNLNGPVTTTYTVQGLLKKAHRQSAELTTTLGELVEVLGPFLKATDALLNAPVERDLIDPNNWSR